MKAKIEGVREHERMVVIPEACGNAAIALGASFACLLIKAYLSLLSKLPLSPHGDRHLIGISALHPSPGGRSLSNVTQPAYTVLSSESNDSLCPH